MTRPELAILLGYLDNVLYLIQRNIKSEKHPEIFEIMTDLQKAIAPIKKRLEKFQ